MRVLVFALLLGCGRIHFGRGADAAGTADVPADSCAFGPWAALTHLDPLATANDDWDLGVSPDGRTFIFSRQITVYDLYRADVVAGVLQSAMLDTALSSPNDEAGPTWSPRGDLLYFSSDRSDGTFHLFTSTFDGTSFGPPTILPELATIRAASPHIAASDVEMFFTDESDLTIHRAIRAQPTDPWQYDRMLDELIVNAGDDSGYPTLTPDGLTLYFDTRRDGDRAIYAATRPAIGARFAVPVRETDLSPVGVETADPELSRDGKTLYLASNRSPSAGGYDLFSTTRVCQ